jgi:hypothetical protein
VTPRSNQVAEARALSRCLSAQRLASYQAHCAGDMARAVALYEWNAAMTGAMWETIGHVEVALRNALSDRLSVRHALLGRPGTWLDDPAMEMDHAAHGDIAKARDRVRRNRKPVTQDQVISELGFGFWRFLLTRRYATTLWPDLAAAFPNSPDRDRATIDRPVHRLHLLRNRLAHHQKVWTAPLNDRWSDMTTLLGYVDADFARWTVRTSRVPDVLSARPAP